MGAQRQGRVPGDNVDTLFECLADSRRRTLIRILVEEETPLGIVPLTERIEKREKHLFDGYGEDTRHQIAISLRHKHLPKLADAGIVVVDRETDTIEKGPHFVVAQSHLEMI